MRTTIKDIANYTGFSVATISLVLNNKAEKIPDSTKKKIKDAAKELNYHPNQVAIGLVKKRTQTIGLVISDVSNTFFSMLTKGVEDTCRQQGWNLILCNTNDDHERELSYIQVLADQGADGILFCMSKDSDKKKTQESLQLLKSLKMPFIMIDRYIENANCSSVVVDHMKGGYIATEYLLESGHRRIGCITGPNNLEDSMERLRGHQKALWEYGVPYDERLIFEGKYDRESGERAVKYFLSKNITAIFSFNDMSAYGAYHELKKHKIKIPDEISLVGYDDIFFSEILDVPLTTVRQPVYDMGVAGAKQLIEELDNKTESYRKILFQPKLIIRDSVADLLHT